jgi:formamidopyrimidine-DNA glycosylase
MPVIGRTITGCDVRRRDVVRDRTRDASNPRRGPIEPLALGVRGEVVGFERRGKQLAMLVRGHVGSEQAIVIQLGMSGQVPLIDTPRVPDAKHVHVVWTLDDGRRVCFRDTRRFGGVTLLGDRDALDRFWAALGPDALSITPKRLRDALGQSRRMVKAALLDQGVLAGVGNIYADEALHLAGIDPRALCTEIDPERYDALARAIRGVLRQAIKARGSTLRDYRDPMNQPGEAQLLHRVYNRAGESCRACGHEIEHCRIAQRSTCWCPVCQPLKP